MKMRSHTMSEPSLTQPRMRFLRYMRHFLYSAVTAANFLFQYLPSSTTAWNRIRGEGRYVRPMPDSNGLTRFPRASYQPAPRKDFF